jgi:tRNA(His) guanylyltransferase|nr:tRNA(His) guanylyltransferase Thg1 family protein [Neorhizobium tomejilense]
MSARYDDALGDCLKALEAVETERCVVPGDCVMVRVDGMTFSNFTSSMDKPYDLGMADAMKATAAALLNDFSAAFVYTQSDEITLVFSPDKIPFDGRLQKIATACAGKATSHFRGEMAKRILDHVESVAAAGMSASEAISMIRKLGARDERLAPAFDGRAISTTPEMAAKFLVWREIDARRNAALGAGRAVFTQSQLGGKSPGDIKDMLLAAGIDFYEAYCNHFRRGTLMRKRQVEMTLTEEELLRIPEHVRDSKRGQTFSRSKIVEVEDRPPFYVIDNITEFALDDDEPVFEDRPFARHIHP